MISINATLVVQVIHFLLLVFVLNRLMLRPLMRQIHEREDYMKQAGVDAQEMAAEVERLVEKRFSMEKEARAKASRERARLKENAWAEADGIFEENRRQASRIRERISAEVLEQVEKAQETLDQEAASLADEIVERIVGRRVSH